jgi:Pyruvate/2-oxoacid:ferredoxin oxidoreductase delta subunit
MDAVQAMEGNGPRGGTPRQVNAILLSTDPVAIDAVMCQLMNLDPALVLTNLAGRELGLGTYLSEEITLLGDPIEPLIVTDYNVSRLANNSAEKTKKSGAFKSAITPRPYIVSEKCVKCGICVNACPVSPKAVNWHDGDKSKPPSYEYDRCIRCYCCQEMCPESAIQIKVPLLRRIIGG